MINKYWFWMLLFAFQFSFSQLKGVVKDSISGQPIPYVNIWVENENIGTTSELDGTFTINTTSDKVLVFSAVGYLRKKARVADNQGILLSLEVNHLKDVLVQKRLGKEQIEINTFKSKEVNSYHSADNKPTIIVTHIKNSSIIEEHPFIQKITFLSNSQLATAKIKLRIYDVAPDGGPGANYNDETIIVSLKKGKRKNTIDVSDQNIIIPKQGLFIGFEWIIIKENKYTFNYTIDQKGNKRIGDLINKTSKIYSDGQDYQPYIGLLKSEESLRWFYSGGKWHKLLNNIENKGHLVFSKGSLAIQLTLTN
ncbi:carboxypeptidase-like regulatory domain-containing protein [Flavobacterium sp. RSSB_23]|uniref:carboxypeptidase-like regulatory domain-containing protein n=1 Tax=Flavobacterium sp. RSSB_23 TaxID=3447668 RepID=UPI003F369D48